MSDTSNIGGIDLTRLLSQNGFNGSVVNPHQQAVVPQMKSATTKTKKKTATAQEKRVKMCVNILQGKDKFGQDWLNLLVQMPSRDAQKLLTSVKSYYAL